MKYLTCAALLTVSSSLYAQDYAFKVFGSKGNNSVSGVPLKIGAKLKDSETVTVDGAYLGLSNSTGKTLELTAKGTYKIKELVAQASKQTSSSLTSKYAAFVVNELTKDDGETPTQNRSKYMNKTGSVERGDDMVIMIPKTDLASNIANENSYQTLIYGNTISLRWCLKPALDVKESDILGYRVLITGLEDIVYHKEDVKTSSFVVTLSGEAANQSNLIVKAIPITKDLGVNPSDDKISGKEQGLMIHKMEKSAAAKVTAELKEICTNPDENINKLITARYFEENGLFVDAMATYEELIKANPSEAKYKKMYQDFLTANKLTKETMDLEVQAKK